MAGSGQQLTTIPLSARSERIGETKRALSLVWIFPNPSEPPVLLDTERGKAQIVGRSEECSIQLSGPDISRRHAQVALEGTSFVVSDLGSRNGTFVNGNRVRSVRVELHDVIRFGTYVALVSEQPGPTETLSAGLLGGPLLRTRLEPLMSVAGSDVPVILEGETGTGKEVVARSLHTWSGRSGSFTAINCAALPDQLVEGELFGYRRGAFTGAERDYLGLFRGANGGTLLLDEVSDLPLSIQPKLLRVLEQREVQPLGEARPLAIDVRIAVATQEPLSQSVQQKRFRRDLLSRLSGIHILLPPLRHRRGDVMPLMTQQLAKLNAGTVPSFDAEFVERVCAYDWPFNVRELVLLAKRLFALHGQEKCLRAAQLPTQFLRKAECSPVLLESARNALADGERAPVEINSLIAALRVSRGNIAQASATLGISRQRAYRLMEGHSVDLDALRKPEGAES